MRAIWTGTLSFGLVNIPVRLFPATEEQKLNLDMLHKHDLSPVRFARVCRADGREIPYEDIVKGYEYQKGDYVVLEKEDFERANVRKTNTIDLLTFCAEPEVSSLYFDRPYYLEPGKGADHAYVLLREALRRSKRVGVARFVLRNREHLALIRPERDVLLLNTLRFKSEIRDPEIKVPSGKSFRGRELDMALQLIEQQSGPFRPEQYRDTYTEELKEVIQEKAKGKTPAPKGKEPAPTQVPDLMAALRASLEREKEKVHA
jgi:DNA end-binding protein Ku